MVEQRMCVFNFEVVRTRLSFQLRCVFVRSGPLQHVSFLEGCLLF